jgi:hypothetical protein
MICAHVHLWGIAETICRFPDADSDALYFVGGIKADVPLTRYDFVPSGRYGPDAASPQSTICCHNGAVADRYSWV